MQFPKIPSEFWIGLLINLGIIALFLLAIWLQKKERISK
jgi:hypothetical protein